MMISQRVARNFIAGLAASFEAKIRDLLEGQVTAEKAKDFAAWLVENFHFQGTKTPKGGKDFKESLKRLYWALTAGVRQVEKPEGIRYWVEREWSALSAHLDSMVQLLSEEGGKVVPKELRIGSNIYQNVSGFSEAQLTGYAKALEQVFDELKGWRKKALVGGLKVALAGPKDFRGTSGGKYKSEEDVLYVRATPQVLKRTRGTYAAFDYIIVHELGHRYQKKFNPREDFDRPQWWTSKYSRTEGFGLSEAFAELFAISNFGLTGPWDSAVVDRFEDFMVTGKIQENTEEDIKRHDEFRKRLC